jgi:acetyl esterase
VPEAFVPPGGGRAGIRRPAGTDVPAAVLADAALAGYVEDVRRTPGVPWCEVGAAELRRGRRERAAARRRGPELSSVEDLTAGQVPARLYRPFAECDPAAAARPAPAAAVPLATVLYLHGGAWVIGDLESHDRACRRLTHATGAAVLAVDFRRAPEHPWPAAVDDAVAAARWAAGALPGPLVLMGDSAGGTIATLACLRLREEGGPRPAAQVLAYPNTDLTLAQPSVREFGTGWDLAAADVAWGAESWVPDPARRADPAVSPLFASDLAGLPPALIVTNAYDPLRDEGEAYARRLAEADTPVRHRREPGMIHGFLTLDTVSPAAAAAGERVFADLVAVLGEDGTGRDEAARA